MHLDGSRHPSGGAPDSHVGYYPVTHTQGSRETAEPTCFTIPTTPAQNSSRALTLSFHGIVTLTIGLAGSIRSDLLAEILFDILSEYDEEAIFYVNKNAEASLEDVALRLYAILAQRTKSEAELRAELDRIAKKVCKKAQRAGFRMDSMVVTNTG